MRAPGGLGFRLPFEYTDGMSAVVIRLLQYRISEPYNAAVYIEQLRSFCAVVDLGSYTRAAAQLHLTQPAVSQHVAALERAFALPLLERAGGRIRATEAGLTVYRHAAEILARMENLRSDIAALKSLQGGQITVGAGISAGYYVLPQIVARFRKRYPEVQVVLRVANAPRIFEDIIEGSVDFGIVLGYQVPPGLVIEPLYHDPLVLVISPDHPTAHCWSGRLPRAVLASLPLVALSSETTLAGRLCEDWLHQAGIEVQVEMEFDSAEPVKRVVAAGMGAAFLFHSNVAEEVAAGQLKILELATPPPVGQYLLARHPRLRPSPAARALVEVIVEGLQEERFVADINQQAALRFVREP